MGGDFTPRAPALSDWEVLNLPIQTAIHTHPSIASSTTIQVRGRSKSQPVSQFQGIDGCFPKYNRGDPRHFSLPGTAFH